jgi:hypothetical protein
MGPIRKRPLSEDDLLLLLAKFDTGEYEDKLFLVILLTGFHGLMRLGEVTQPDAKVKRSFSKLTMRHSLNITPHTFRSTSPTTKETDSSKGISS